MLHLPAASLFKAGSLEAQNERCKQHFQVSKPCHTSCVNPVLGLALAVLPGLPLEGLVACANGKRPVTLIRAKKARAWMGIATVNGAFYRHVPELPTRSSAHTALLSTRDCVPERTRTEKQGILDFTMKPVPRDKFTARSHPMNLGRVSRVTW